MQQLTVVPIVEGYGEQEAVRILLTRIWIELLGGHYIEVLAPIRLPRTRIGRPEELSRAARLARAKLRQKQTGAPSLVLILVDADDDLPCAAAPVLLEELRQACPDLPTACVMARRQYEAWFVAAAESLASYWLKGWQAPVRRAESISGKKWVKDNLRGVYSETVDMPAMTKYMDLPACRQHCPSFDKLCRELGRFAPPARPK